MFQHFLAMGTFWFPFYFYVVIHSLLLVPTPPYPTGMKFQEKSLLWIFLFLISWTFMLLYNICLLTYLHQTGIL